MRAVVVALEGYAKEVVMGPINAVECIRRCLREEEEEEEGGGEEEEEKGAGAGKENAR